MRENFFPKGWEDIQRQFLELFHRQAYICKPLSGGSWFSANEKWSLTDSEILKSVACVHPKYFVGCRAAASTRFAVFDIDANSKYHDKTQLKRLLSVLANAGISKSSLYRSSYSGGWHLYIFFEEPVHSSELRRLLVKLLVANNFDVAKGTLEIFPNRSDRSLGMGLRLPLQPGFAWLDSNDLEVIYERAQLSATKALELFIDALESDAISYFEYKRFKAYVGELELRKSKANAHGLGENTIVPLRSTHIASSEFTAFVKAVFGKLPPGIIVDNWYKGRSFHLNGLTGASQRAEAITCVGHYFFYGDPSRDLPPLGYGYEQEREWALNHFLSERHNGQSKDINDGRADALLQVSRAANWYPSHKQGDDFVKYSGQRPISWIRANDNKEQDARQRIQLAVDQLRAQQRAFTTVEMQKSAQCSRRTLYRHQDIWRAVYEDRINYRDLSAGFFANCTVEYNDAVGADSPKIEPPSAALSENTPPGLLAARRIASEISRRSNKHMAQNKKANAALDSSWELAWKIEVTALTSHPPQLLSAEKINYLLVVLARYLSLAPNEDEQLVLQLHLRLLRHELDCRRLGPHSPDG